LRTHRYAAVLAEALRAGGLTVGSQTFFDTLTVSVPGRAEAVVATARRAGLHLRLVDADTVGLSTSETTTTRTLAEVLAAFGLEQTDLDEVDRTAPSALPEELRRSTDYLSHEVFNSHHSETQMLRYLNLLARRDYALD